MDLFPGRGTGSAVCSEVLLTDPNHKGGFPAFAAGNQTVSFPGGEHVQI